MNKKEIKKRFECLESHVGIRVSKTTDSYSTSPTDWDRQICAICDYLGITFDHRYDSCGTIDAVKKKKELISGK